MSDLFGNHVGFPTRRLIYSLGEQIYYSSIEIIEVSVLNFLNSNIDKSNSLSHHRNYRKFNINPYLTNGFSHHYHLDESSFIFWGFR